MLKGEPALVDSTSPRWGEKACYYSGVCLESGEVEAMEIAGNSNAETSTAFLQQLRENHPGPLVVIWDNGPAHRGEAIRSYLATPDLHLRLVALPAYSPDFNADEAVWDWAREEVTANECLGTKAQVQEKMKHSSRANTPRFLAVSIRSTTTTALQRYYQRHQASSVSNRATGRVLISWACHARPRVTLYPRVTIYQGGGLCPGYEKRKWACPMSSK